jgi:hypothetical protein
MKPHLSNSPQLCRKVENVGQVRVKARFATPDCIFAPCKLHPQIEHDPKAGTMTQAENGQKAPIQPDSCAAGHPAVADCFHGAINRVEVGRALTTITISP